MGHLRGPSDAAEAVWVVIRRGHLSIYKDKKDADEYFSPLHLINISTITFLKRCNDFSFELKYMDDTGTSSMVKLWCDDKESMLEWAVMVKEIRERAA
jgi:hypothetical protein